MTDTHQYELLFEGASDDSAETIRRVKGVLIADLELPVDRVREILESAPIVIQQAQQEESLKRSLQSLRRAGAKVHIVSPKSSPEAETAADETFTFELDLSDGKPPSTLHHDIQTMTEENDPDLKSEVDALLNQLSETEIIKVAKFPPAPELPRIEIPPSASSEEPTAHEPLTPAPSAAPHSTPSAPDSNSWGLEIEAPSAVPTAAAPSPATFVAHDLSVEPAPEPLVVTPPTPPVSKAPTSPQPGPLVAKQALPKPHTTTTTTAPLAHRAPPKAVFPNPAAHLTGGDIINSPAPTEERMIGLEISLSKKRRHFELSMETMITICLSAIVVVIGNWVYQNIHANSAGSLSVALPTSVQEDLPTISTRDDIALPTQTLVAVTSADDHELRARIVRQGDNVIGVFLRLTTPPPAPLSAEETVRGVAPRPWLSKIEAEGLEISHRADGSFRAQGYGRAFVDQGDLHRRLPVEVTLESSAPSPTGAMRIEVRFTRSVGTVSPLDEITPFVVGPDGSVRLNYRSTFTAVPSKGTPEAAPAVPAKAPETVNQTTLPPPGT